MQLRTYFLSCLGEVVFKLSSLVLWGLLNLGENTRALPRGVFRDGLGSSFPFLDLSLLLLYSSTCVTLMAGTLSKDSVLTDEDNLFLADRNVFVKDFDLERIAVNRDRDFDLDLL